MKDTATIQTFRTQLHDLFPKRAAVMMELIDSLCCEGHRHKSVVQLSQARNFTRAYSSISDAINANAESFQETDFQKSISKLLHQSMTSEPRRYYGIDVTPQPRPYSKKLADRTVVHAPNPAPGNKPITTGHGYSIIAGLSTQRHNHWVTPVSIQRVPSDQKGHEFGMTQFSKLMKHLDNSTDLKISVGDSLYGTHACRKTAVLDLMQVHLFRLRISRNLFLPAPLDQKAKGRKSEYGKKLPLKDISGWHKPDEEVIFELTSAKGKPMHVTLKRWNDLLIRGTREFRSAQHPIDAIQVEVKDAQGKEIFKRPLWVALLGNRKAEIELKEAYNVYGSRYDLEHYFRFGKNNLLMDEYQTPEVDYEEAWWVLCAMAYIQLYHGKELVEAMPNPWERYLPAFQQMAENIATPTQTQRGFQVLLDFIGTPAAPCVPRGNPKGRKKGQTPLAKRENQPVLFKDKAQKPSPKTDVAGSENTPKKPDPKKMKRLLKTVIEQLQESGFSPQDFIGLLQNAK